MLAENRKALAAYRSDFLEKLQKAAEKKTKEETFTIELGQARDGNSVLYAEKDGKLYRLNSAFRPVQEADRWAQQYNFDYLENIVIMFGFGNGIFVTSLLKRLQKKDKLIVYEPSLKIFQMILEQEDISSILSDARVSLIVEDINPSDFYFILEVYLSWRNIDALCICEHPEYGKLFGEQLNSLAKQIVECKELVHVLKHTDAHLAHQTIINYFYNMRYIKQSNMLADFTGKIPEELPAIIVSAGPSLDKNIEELKRAEGKAFILAVDSAVKVLVSHGVRFDAFISVDANKWFGRIDSEECRSVPLFGGLMSNGNITDFHKGKKIWIMGARYIDNLYSDLGHPFQPINIGGSVATAAFSTCEKLGFKRIILVGQDLAYDGETTHAGGAVRKIVNEQIGQEEVDAWSGGKVRSRYDWIIYRNWFESAIQQLPGVQVIDATEGGALIHGSKTMRLSEVIDTYCVISFSMRNLLEQAPPTFDEEEYVSVRKNLLHLERELENIYRESINAIIVCDEVIHLVEQLGADIDVVKQAKKLAAANNYIYTQNVYQLLDYYITEAAVEDLKNINRMTGSKEQDLTDTYLSAKAMYESLVNAVKDLKEYIKLCLKEV